MNEEDFMSTIVYFGEDKILGFTFDNSARHLFTKEKRFSLEENYIPQIKHLIFEVEDPRGVKFLSARHISNIQGILVAKDESDWDKISTRFISW